jgi:hypothetical protein
MFTASPTTTTATRAIDSLVINAPECTTTILAALHTQDKALLNWLINEDDNLLPEWKVKYDLWKATQQMIVAFGGEPTK